MTYTCGLVQALEERKRTSAQEVCRQPAQLLGLQRRGSGPHQGIPEPHEGHHPPGLPGELRASGHPAGWARPRLAEPPQDWQRHSGVTRAAGGIVPWAATAHGSPSWQAGAVQAPYGAAHPGLHARSDGCC